MKVRNKKAAAVSAARDSPNNKEFAYIHLSGCKNKARQHIFLLHWPRCCVFQLENNEICNILA